MCPFEIKKEQAKRNISLVYEGDISFLQNHAIEKNYERIQILTKEKLPAFDTLEHKISFHLMKKNLV